jgi:hypothetical protein
MLRGYRLTGLNRAWGKADWGGQDGALVCLTAKARGIKRRSSSQRNTLRLSSRWIDAPGN